MFEEPTPLMKFTYLLAWCVAVILLGLWYRRHIKQHSVDVQRFAFGRTGRILEMLDGAAAYLAAMICSIPLFGWDYFRESNVFWGLATIAVVIALKAFLSDADVEIGDAGEIQNNQNQPHV